VITTPSRYAPPWLSIAGFLAGMAGIAASITVVFLGMRSVLDVGGQCASGGPYDIAVPCPDGTWTLPLAIFAGLGFAFLAGAAGSRIGGLYASMAGLAWVGLFCSLGFNFLQWGIAPPADPSVDSSGGGIIFILLGVMFEVMGIVPLVTTLLAFRPGASRPATDAGGGSLGGGSSFDPSELMKTAEAYRASAGFQPGTFQPGTFQASTGGQPVDLKELMSEVTAAVAEARAKGVVGPMVLGPTGLTGLGAAAGGGSLGGGGGDLVAELERLTTLHQAGNLTDEEFTAAKQNLIKGQS
jgi:hypothetical protein